MKLRFLLRLFLVLSLASSAQLVAQPVATSEVLGRIFRISYPDTNTHGTCFAIDVDDRQYLVTAKHVVAGIMSNSTVRLFHESQWKEVPIQYLKCPNTNADVAVLIPAYRISYAGSVEVTSNGMFIGQEVNFLGFPFGLYTEAGKAMNGFPVCFVKRGLLSGWEAGVLWLDGINNPGFSGGPVVVNIPGSNQKRIIGIVSGYLTVEDAVRYRGRTTEFRSPNNTGLIKCWAIENALEAIRSDPRGPRLK